MGWYEENCAAEDEAALLKTKMHVPKSALMKMKSHLKKKGKGKKPEWCLSAEDEAEVAGAIAEMGDDDVVTIEDYEAIAEAEGWEPSEEELEVA